MFADGAFTGGTLAKLGRWTVEIFKRSDHAAGFDGLPADGWSKAPLSGSIATTVLPRISITLRSVKASLFIASVQLSMRRVA
jgi:hypothetical protein